MTEEIKDQRVTIMMSKSEVAAVDKWCHQFRVKSRGEGIRHLIETGMSMPDAAADVIKAFNPQDGEEELNKAMARLLQALHRHDSGVAISLEDPVVDTDIQPSFSARIRHPQVDDLVDSLVELILSSIEAKLPDPGSEPKLTRREDEIAKLIASGTKEADIAKAIGVNEAIVAVMVQNIEKKLGKK